ncbi:beta-ketoacyl-[acyl-carrier-protein] synthase family protein [Fulvivirga sediminis]|uniref:Beta-ketoacyl-[acyl-carrier-protein] synthase family protein n=1 Tax=Fulvivirga sediminis TaxID=2803949 RepID=A0A937F835_9BACT|nr:beta-ketoacyl-[acyl-carrier-protein] synthase family protein [Fulvivirga sediminis]MBL3656836.1 beta-ketoacyl-[acyl-carrier-protein] synthase family protein [Fulvivirga sediminis]
MSKVYITGFGIVSSLGVGVELNLASLKGFKSGISMPSFLQTSHKELPVGELKFSNEELGEKLRIKKCQSVSRTALLGLLAAEEALEMASLQESDLKRAALINGTSVGGMDVSELAYPSVLNNSLKEYRNAFENHDCGAISQYMARHLKIHGHIETISTACSSSANSIMNAGRLIRAGMADKVLAGGTDALSIFTLNGFGALKILDPQHCKPFDATRKGLNLGEGAAFLVLESERSVEERGAPVLGELVGYGNCNDAYHQTASSPDGLGAYLAMGKALKIANLLPQEVDYINAHGTGTQNNDMSESKAIKKLFSDDIPVYSSTKAYTGHALGAAGAIEAVYSLLSIREQVVFPNLNVEAPMDILPDPITKVQPAKIQKVLSNSLGFGGNSTSLIFSSAS